MLIQGQPTILSPMNSPMSVRTSAFSGLGGFGEANVNDAQIAAYVQSVLSNASMTPQEQAANIAAAAQANGVSVGDISRATGYDASTVTSFLDQAVAPSAPQPAPSYVTYSAPVDTIVNTTAFTPATPAPPTPEVINNYVQSVLNDTTLTLQQQAKEIAATAANNNVSVQQIAAATGYDVATVTTFLAQAVPTASTEPAIQPPQNAPVTPAQTAPTTEQIKNFVQKTLSDPTINDIQKATLIANTAITENVTVNQIVNATGYDLATTLNYLSQAKIDTAAAANSVAYQSFTQAVADQASAQHLVDQAAAVRAQQDAADAAKAAAKLVADQASEKTKAQQDAALAQIQATVLAAQKKAADDAAALAAAKVKAAATPTKANVDLVAKLNTVASTSSQTLQKTTEVLKTATNQVANNQPITVATTATGTGTNFLPILLAAGAFLMGQ
jgi:DNA-binding MarR family transcriptional regulator